MNLIMGDCLDRMAEIPDGSVDAVICDPPYGTMRGLDVESHGMSGKTGWDTALNPEDFLHHCNRVLRMNGALVLFSQEPYTSRLIVSAHANIPFSYRMVWIKDHFANSLIAKKAPVSYFEDVLVFFKKYDTLYQHPLHDYASNMLSFIGKPRKVIFEEMGSQGAFHWFLGKNSIQFGLCTRRTYQLLIEIYQIDKEDWFLTYDELKAEDSKFKDRLSRRFNLPDGKKFKSNILEYKKDYTGHHPTQKPVRLMEDLVKTYTNEGETVLDFTMGSGSTGVACANTNRKFIGIERDPNYFQIAKDRIEEAQQKLI